MVHFSERKPVIKRRVCQLVNIMDVMLYVLKNKTRNFSLFIS